MIVWFIWKEVTEKIDQLNKINPFRTGILNTDFQQVLKKDQAVEIISEDSVFYFVRENQNSIIKKVEKKYIILYWFYDIYRNWINWL